MTPTPETERIAQRAFLQIECPSFDALPLRSKLLAYHLSRAAIHLDPIYVDQMADYGLAAKHLLLDLAGDPERLPALSRQAILDYTKLFLANHGNRNESTGRKFLPELSAEEFAEAARAALGSTEDLDRQLSELERPLFDPNFAVAMTDKGSDGSDFLESSANNLYSNVRLADLEGGAFEERYPLNSRLVRTSAGLVEEVYRAGDSNGNPPGLYARELGAVVESLEAALPYADPQEAAAISALARFYRTGEPADWHDYNRLWLQADGAIDFVSGFVEVYRDARGAKGSAQMIVVVHDQAADALMRKIAESAAYFEARAPWDDRFKNPDPKPPVGKAVETVIATGDFHVSAIGVNLPNEQELRETCGSKSLLFTSSMSAIGRVRGSRVAELLGAEPDAVANFQAHGALASRLHTALHEILGHGSGKCLTDDDPQAVLQEVYSTLEETRADLVSYYHAADAQKLAELGVPEPEEVWREMIRQLGRTGLVTLNRYPEGDTVEEDHDRNRLLIVNWLVEDGAFARFERDGHWYQGVAEWDRVRPALARLLAEVMRIKATGDLEAGRALVERYAIRFDPAVRDDVVARFRDADIPTYWAGIYPRLEPVTNEQGEIVDIQITLPRDFLAQQMEWARINGASGL